MGRKRESLQMKIVPKYVCLSTGVSKISAYAHIIFITFNNLNKKFTPSMGILSKIPQSGNMLTETNPLMGGLTVTFSGK